MVTVGTSIQKRKNMFLVFDQELHDLALVEATVGI